ncbi:LacI family DNA-binding transcriptional regulator [Pelagicoccus mobilis]|uniref:LacI family DNA-binding transcriptional regulator n=1 Tax=Pelagicoccus mobilis TaxID=415221 RepID=A0A934RW90_9BACT|nr:LacI family DNA-binding transcriptional regulator [Pelagicoccus mobilis]MBK1875562.1 LacI family DNA-binding transcriptional regulator [Pelagicoccus mobilis]
MRTLVRSMSGEQGRRVTLRDVAASLGVSHSTVSRALRGASSISEKTRKRVQAAADELGYRPDPMLSALARYRNDGASRSSKARLALVVGPHLRARFSAFSEAARVHAELLGYDYELYVWDEKMSARRHSQILKSRGVRGIVLCPLIQKLEMEHPKLAWDDFSVITFGRFVAEPKLDCVSENQFHALRLCLQKAYEFGYKRPGLVTLERTNIRVGDRYRAAFDSFMLTLPEESRVPALITEHGIQDKAEEWIESEGVDLLIGHQFIGELLEAKGWRIPEDIAFAALDKQGSDVSVTCYAGATHDDLEIARLAIAALNDQITSGLSGVPKSPKTVLLDTYWSDGKTIVEVGGA